MGQVKHLADSQFISGSLSSTARTAVEDEQSAMLQGTSDFCAQESLGLINGEVQQVVDDKEPLEEWRLVLLTTAMGGVTLGYGLQVGGGTAVMRNMGISNRVTQAVWLFGPISGER